MRATTEEFTWETPKGPALLSGLLVASAVALPFDPAWAVVAGVLTLLAVSISRE